MPIIICPYCQKSLKKIKKYPNHSSLYQCSCLIYPQIESIIYLKNDSLRTKLINCLINNKEYLHYFSFSFASRVIFQLFPIKFVIKITGYRLFLKFLVFVGYNKGWTKYLLNRSNIPSFILAKLFLNLIKDKKSLILDIGCGTGNLLPYIYKHTFQKNIIAIDKDFLSLFIAKFCFAKSKTILICCDVNNTLPFKSHTFDNVFIIDTLHYIKNSQIFFKNLKNVVKNNFEGAIIHTLNADKNQSFFEYKKQPRHLKKILLKSGFTNFKFISNIYLWKNLINSGKVNLKNDNVNKKSVYNVVFTKKKTIALPKKDFKKATVNYYQDKYLAKL